MKKCIYLLVSAVLIVAMALCLTACGGTETSTESLPAVTDTPAEAAEGSGTENEPVEAAWRPEEPVNMIVPYSAGGSTDLLARAVEAVWPKYCDQPIVIGNYPGGGGVTGAMMVASAAPDGYTIGIGYGSGPDMSMPFLQEVDYDPFEMLDPVCLLSVHTVMIVVRSDSEFDSMSEVVEWSRENNTPITASVSGINGTIDLAFKAFAYYTGADINIVPHDSSSGAITDLLSGAYMIGGGHPSDVLPYVQSGQLKCLAVATDERDSAMPDVPTLREQGIDFTSFGSIKGIMVPEDTPEEIVDYYEQLFAEIAADEEFIDSMLSMGQPVMYMGTEEFAEYFAEASEGNRKVIEDLGLAYYQQ